ncbi:MAG: energy transducer TonB [Candidatus Aminicenantes bacterium]|nr:MAG: energy transducer TonB [Candidatus Aminicenantes bacterium]
MSRKKIMMIVLGFLMMSGLMLHADYVVELKTRFYAGAREGKVEAPEFVTSSYLRPTVTATIPARFLLSDEKAQIGKVFNLKDVNLIAEADLQMSVNTGSISHLLRLNGKTYRMEIAIQSKKESTHQFKIAVFEQADGEETHLMDTDVILPQKKMAVLGFENKEGKPYFLSFHVTNVSGTPPTPPSPPQPPTATSHPTSAPAPPPPPPREIKQNKKKIEEFEKGAVRCVGKIKPPRLIKKVNPVYPEKARQARVEGNVILGTRTDAQGRVSRVMVYRSKTPLLNAAAIDAVEQWIYEPLIIEGEPVEAVFTTSVRFELKPQETETSDVIGGIVGGVLKIEDTADVPRCLKKVEPFYPLEARKALVQGVVVLEITTDEEGNVAKVAVVRSDSSLLNQASIDAVKQWKYEPVMSKGSPVRVSFYVTLTFRLK